MEYIIKQYNLSHIIDPMLPGVYKLTDPTRTIFFCFDTPIHLLEEEEKGERIVDIMINKEGIYDPEKQTESYNSDEVVLITFQVFCTNKEGPDLINEYMSELHKYVGMQRLLMLEKLRAINSIKTDLI